MAGLPKLISSVFFAMLAVGSVQAREYKMAMSWSYEASQAGYIAALDRGLYRAAGVDMSIDRGYGAGDTIRRLVVGDIDFAVADAALVINAVVADPKNEMIFVTNILQTSHYGALYVKNRKIKSLDDLRTAKFGDTGGSIGLLYPTFVNVAMRREGKPPVTLNRVKLDASLGYPALLTGDVDIIASSAMQMAFVKPRAKEAGLDLARFEFSDYGFDPYTYGIAVRRDFAEKNPEVVKAVVAATLQGWAWTCQNPKEAIPLLTRRNNAVPELVQEELDITLKHVGGPSADAHGLGYMDPAHWEETRTMTILGFNLNEAATPPAAKFYDAKYMPSEPIKVRCGQ
jgi:NitT/TauT family transport system substrate-binding protein